VTPDIGPCADPDAANRDLQTRVRDLEQQLEAHRSTFSWRITAPLRALRRRLGSRSGAAVGPPTPAAAPASDYTPPTSRTSTFAYNREIWDNYAKSWDDPEFRRRQLDDATGDPASLEVLGDEWGRPSEVQMIVDSWIKPYLSQDAIVGEVGPGAGRVARQIVRDVSELWCFDASSEMLERLRRTLTDVPNVRYVLLEEPGLPTELHQHFDFVYAFDVLVHFDVHLLWQHVRDLDRVLRPGGRAFLHTTNLEAPEGWKRFAQQSETSVEGHFFLTPDTVRTLLSHTNLSVSRESTPDAESFYLARDYLCVVEKVASPRSAP
jgi:SAM-dependent methyltransferase